MAAKHPSEVLFGAQSAPCVLPVCDHYAGSEALIIKSLALQRELGAVFDVTADCEDGASVGSEREHATMVADLVASAHNGHDRLGVRIHDPSHHCWRDEVEIVVGAAGARLAFVTIPKVDSRASIDLVVAHIDALAARSAPGREIPVHALIETHAGLRAAWEIAAHPRVQCLSFGLLDYVSGFDGAVPLSAMHSPGQFEHPLIRRAKAEISIAAHSCGKVPSHGVCTNVSDAQAAGDDAARALAEFGFTRMWSIHPSQVRTIVAALSPTSEQVSTAAQILLAARAADWGPIRHAGKLEDRASYRYWWALLRRAHGAGTPMSEAARQAFFD
ncbi:MAG: CoA ester lyase [Burkholderiaceae bacterium]|nr:CoA ester lyase [Burkholderiaceae bacterium]